MACNHNKRWHRSSQPLMLTVTGTDFWSTRPRRGFEKARTCRHSATSVSVTRLFFGLSHFWIKTLVPTRALLSRGYRTHLPLFLCSANFIYFWRLLVRLTHNKRLTSTSPLARRKFPVGRCVTQKTCEQSSKISPFVDSSKVFVCSSTRSQHYSSSLYKLAPEGVGSKFSLWVLLLLL